MVVSTSVPVYRKGHLFDVITVGHAIVDILARVDDALLDTLGLVKGQMALVDRDSLAAILGSVEQLAIAPGGSAANTATVLTSLGATSALLGKVARDALGDSFVSAAADRGITFYPGPDVRAGTADEDGTGGKRQGTAACAVLVSPDGERTMATYLGIASSLDEGDVTADVIVGATLLYVEGYLLDSPTGAIACQSAVAYALDDSTAVALSLSDAACVRRNKPVFLDLLSRAFLVFGNEQEVGELFGTREPESLARLPVELNATGATIVLTCGARGSFIIQQGCRPLHVDSYPTEKVVDATGAGDAYAGGFVYGWMRGLPLERCGQLASLCAAEVVSHVGASPEVDLAGLARANGLIS